MARVQLEKRAGPTKKAVLKGLAAYNRSKIGEQRWKRLAVSIRDDDGEIVGGVCGEIWGNVLFVALVWLDEAHRGCDHMSRAMDVLEAEATALGANLAYVDTLSFQARPFYEKRGYKLFGQIDGYFGGERRFWLTKPLAPRKEAPE